VTGEPAFLDGTFAGMNDSISGNNIPFSENDQLTWLHVGETDFFFDARKSDPDTPGITAETRQKFTPALTKESGAHFGPVMRTPPHQRIAKEVKRYKTKRPHRGM
jgi:hypothetical protein